MKSRRQKMSPRFATIDSLRGIAAMGVVFYHLSGNLQAEFSWLPKPVLWFFGQGHLGVPIFFVLSGLVICHSVGDSRVTGGYLANFAWRRSLRLDPPYWVAIVLALALLLFKGRFLGLATEFPTTGNIIAHFFYLQDLLGFPPAISSVYWTLCLEVQLYVFFILSLWLAQILGRRLRRSHHSIHLVLTIGMGLYSLAVNHGLLPIPFRGTFFPYWHYFLMGMLLNLAMRRKPLAITMFAAWFTVEIAVQSFSPIRSYVVAGMLASLFLFWVWRRGSLTTTLDQRVLRYLGRISYSLYLLHPDVGWKSISVAKELLGRPATPVVSVLLFLLGLVVSLVMAHALHRFVERPAMQFSARFKKPRRSAS